MLTTPRVKLFLALIICAAALTGFWYAVRGAGALIAYFSHGANPAAALNIVPNVPPNLHVDLRWLPDDEDASERVDALMRRDIEAAYLRAWLQISLSLARREPWGLETYFDGPALRHVEQSIEELSRAGFEVAQIDGHHELQLHFCSADRSVVGLTDRASVSVLSKGGALSQTTSRDLESDYDVVLFLSDGYWKVRQWKRTGGKILGVAPQTGEPVASLAACDAREAPGGRPALRAAGYSGREAVSAEFWARYDADAVALDFAEAARAGLNALIVDVPFTEFGGADLEPTAVRKLEELLAQAAKNDLKVLLTLFASRDNFDVLRWNEADRHAQRLGEVFAPSRSLFGWILYRAPVAEERRNRELADAWFAHVRRELRRVDAKHPVGIGSMDSLALARMHAEADFLVYDVSQTRSAFADGLKELRRNAGHMPLLVSGVGYSTWQSHFAPSGGGEVGQADYFLRVSQLARDHGACGIGASSLLDREKPSWRAFGLRPWKAMEERYSGLLASDRSPKLAAAVFAGASEDVGGSPLVARWTQPFARFALAALLAVLAVLVWRRRALFHGERRRSSQEAGARKTRRKRRRRPRGRRKLP